MSKKLHRAAAAATAALTLLSATAWAVHDDAAGRARTVRAAAPHPGEAAARVVTALSTTTTTAPPPPAPPPAPQPAPAPPTTARPKPAPKPKAAAAGTLSAQRLTPPPVAQGLAPYVGLGTWVDVYDWTNSYTKNNPATRLADIDAMADRGVQTLYIQASKHDAAQDLADPDLLLPLLRRAKERGMKTVGWYLPTLVDLQRDLQRTLAVARLADVDSVAIDIEARNVGDVNDRNRRLVEYSRAVREALPGRTLGAIVLPPVVLEVVNPNYWPDFPYKAIAASYDVWMTMGYWTNRKADSGYRDAYRYTKENVDRLRANVGKPDLPVHPIGGLGDNTTPADVDAYRRAAIDTRSLGGSLYDWRTTRSECWAPMAGFRA